MLYIVKKLFSILDIGICKVVCVCVYKINTSCGAISLGCISGRGTTAREVGPFNFQANAHFKLIPTVAVLSDSFAICEDPQT